MQTNINNRSTAQDIVKGFLILAVIFFHAHLFTLEDATTIRSSFQLIYCFFPFLMAVFLFYSGYNYTPGKRTIKQNIIRRSKQLLLPLLGLWTVGNLLQIIIVMSTNVATWEGVGNALLYTLMSEPLAFMIHFPESGILSIEVLITGGIGWYLYALWFSSVIFYLIVDHVINKPARLISTIIGLLSLSFVMGQFIGPYLPYAINSYPLIVAIMLLASYLKKFNFLDAVEHTKKSITYRIINCLVAEGLIVAISLICYYQFGAILTGVLAGGEFNAVLKGFDALIAFFFCISGTYVIHSLALLVGHIPYLSFGLSWLGKRSGAVYLSHLIILSFIHNVIFQHQFFFGEGQNYIYLLLSVIIFVILGVTFDLIMKQISKHTKPKGTQLNS